MEAVTRAAAVGRGSRGAKAAMVPKPNSRLMVKLPSKLRTALTHNKHSILSSSITDGPAATGGSQVSKTSAVMPSTGHAPPAAASASSSSISSNRCCCCCSASACSKTTDPADLDQNPILRQPVNLGSKNVRGLLKSVTDGTSEVKDLILNECDIIFECKACRSLFRSLCNFLEHKRQFCLSHACEKMLLYDPQRIDHDTSARSPARNETSLQLIEPADPPPVSHAPPVAVPTEVLPNGIQIPASRRTRRLDVCIQKLTKDKNRTVEQHVPGLILTPIASTTQAVFQSQIEVVADEVVAEPVPAERQMNQMNGHPKAQKPSDTSTESVDPPPVPIVPEIPAVTESCNGNASMDESPVSAPPVKKKMFRSVKCGICGSDFVSNKTLRVHMKTLHASQRLIYPCPFCCLTFTQICNATRHMHQVHKKGKMDVKRLREIVRMRAKVADDGHRSKSPEKQESDPGFHEDMDMTPDTDRSSAADQTLDPDLLLEEHISEKPVPETGHVCQGCNKFFPRIASKIGHEKVCDALKKSSRKKVKADPVLSATSSQSSSRTDDFGFHPFDSIYDNEPITITAVIKAGLQKVASTKKLRCFECPTLKFKNNVHLIRHAVAHMNEEIFACNDCVYQSLSKADIDSHAATMHGNEPVKGSPPNKIIIKPSEIVTIRDLEFDLPQDNESNSSSSTRQPNRAVSVYNTTRLKTRKKKVFKKLILNNKCPSLLPQPLVTSANPVPSPVTLAPISSLLEEPVVDPLVNLPPPPPLMPQPPPVTVAELSDIPFVTDVPPPVPTLLPAVLSISESNDDQMNGQVGDDSSAVSRPPSIWSPRPKKLRRLVPKSLPVVPAIKPFGGQIAKRIRQAKKINYKEVIKSHPVTKSLLDAPVHVSDPAIQPLKILIHKEVTSGKKTTYAVSSVTDQNP